MHPLTPQQEAIIEAVKASNDNLLIEARAGAGKTSTLLEILPHLKGSTLFLAFNRRIADELDAKASFHSGVMVKTINGFCYGVLREHLRLPSRFRIDKDKSKKALTHALSCKGVKDKNTKDFYDIVKVVDFAKALGYMPDDPKSLISREDFFSQTEEILDKEQEELVIMCLQLSFSALLDGEFIDFNDQVLGAVMLSTTFPFFNNVLVDEAQDLSPLNHRLLERLVGPKQRLIAVGDPHQAIYAFRGAHQSSMKILGEKFSASKLSLTKSFRCPENIILEARKWVPEIEAFLPGGKVTHLDDWQDNISELFSDGDTILCRYNRPLLSLAIKLFINDKNPNFVGGQFLQRMQWWIKKHCPGGLMGMDAVERANQWCDEVQPKTRSSYPTEMRDCLTTLFTKTITSNEALSMLRSMVRAKGKINLMTFHKSKGLEWPRVFILPGNGREGTQEENLHYVSVTRAQKELVYLTQREQQR